MKQRQCQHTKEDLTKCTSFAMNESDFCYRHNPDITPDEKINASSKGGKSNEEFIETPLPAMKIEKLCDVVSVLADSINQVRAGKISQKTGGTLAYMSFILLMAMDKANEQAKKEEISKLKAEGKWRPEPRYSPKFYCYKDEYFLDKDGNHLIVEKDGSTFRPEMVYKLEDKPEKKLKPAVKNTGIKNDFTGQTAEIINALKEGMEIQKKEEINSS